LLSAPRSPSPRYRSPASMATAPSARTRWSSIPRRHKLPLLCIISLNGGWTADPERNKPGRDLGYIRYDKMAEGLGMLCRICRTARGQPAGTRETEGGHWLVHYADVELGYIHPQRRRLCPRPLCGGIGRPGDLMEIAATITTTPQAQQPHILDAKWIKMSPIQPVQDVTYPAGSKCHPSIRFKMSPLNPFAH